MQHRLSSFSFALTAAAALLAGCGGGSTPVGPGPQPSATPTATPTPAPTPTPDPQAGLPPGPVVRSVLYIYQQYENGNANSGGVLIQKRQDAQGRWIAKRGDFIVFDTTPLNAVGDKCRSDQVPAYRMLDPERAFIVRGSSNPFLFRVDVVANGEVELVSTVDRIDSAPLRVIVQ
jgi:hypothetical protein